MLEPQIDELCDSLSRKLASGSFQFTQYRELLVSKGAGRPPRQISVPTARDRIVLRALAEFLAELYPGCQGVLPQQRIDDVKRALGSNLGFNSFVRLDVVDFYPSIPHAVVKSALRRRIRKREPLRMIEQAIQTPAVPDRGGKRPRSSRGVPQGIAISNILAEMIAKPIDDAMSKDNRCAYFRFVDDILLLCRDADQDRLAGKVRRLFARHDLDVPALGTTAKCVGGSLSDSFDFLGYVFDKDSVSVRRSSVHKLEASLARTFTQYKREVSPVSGEYPSAESIAEAARRCERAVNLRITGFTHKHQECGWVQYFRQMDDYGLLKSLDATVRRFAARFDLPRTVRLREFTKTYWATRHPSWQNWGYIPNFDRMTFDKKFALVSDMLGERRAASMGEQEIEEQFLIIAERFSRDIERDIGSVS
ncbi:reverse transcriptase domain-containing protein [Pseudonocardia halophobica]|uniref:reverse transcriptase domain-containing protein n=1 Tax=Pseudonocardia halophobica TaxID=29401 RepID=UPI003D8EC2CF